VKQILSIFFDFIWYSINQLLKIFSFGCLAITLVIIFLCILIYMIVTGRYDPIHLIFRWFF